MDTNKQFLRTERAIGSAFLSLLAKKPFEKITVQDILDATPVSRATFYKHYRDKFEIAEKMQAELIASYKELFTVLSRSGPELFSVLVQQHGLRHLDTARLLMQVRTEYVDLPRTLNKAAEARYLSDADSETKELEARIYGAAVSTYFTELLEHNYQLGAEELGRIMPAVAQRISMFSHEFTR